MQLRPYQQEVSDGIYAAWRLLRYPLAVLPTGAGKTVLFSSIIHAHKGASCAIAHRQELVSQISLALAREGVRHFIIGPKNVIKNINQLHMEELGRSYYDPNAKCAVAGVDTLVRRADEIKHWLEQVTLWVMDEAHHVLTRNKWGKAVELFPNAKGLGVTATPTRADGCGLGAHADGVFQCMVQGPSMRELIDARYLTEYRIFAPPSDLNLEGINTSKDGDYNRKQLTQRVSESHIMGDVVDHYLKLAPSLPGVTFATDVQTATEISTRFNNRGVPAEVVSAKTPDRMRSHILRRFRNREVLQLVNVDLFGEGFDLPAIEVVSMARPTQSYGLYVQQFGRSLRLMGGKENAIIIDHVGNVLRHGLPDAPREWSLDRREKRSKAERDPDLIPTKACIECTAMYEAYHKACPFCGHIPVPEGRSAPEYVDGDLSELDPGTLAKMRAEVARVDESPERIKQKMIKAGAPALAAMGAAKQRALRQEAQGELRESIALWAGHQKVLGREDSESYRRFFHGFGVDVLSAQALNRVDSNDLNLRVTNHIERMKG